MGLCKCPKRRVTNQFCFEHRVNVCEHCMVTNHPKCVVQSYLQWLQDSDYNPICELCTKELNTEDCIRLICYHVYHWKCIDQYARQLPSTTAPAGYTCPSCGLCLFPASNLVSPVGDILKGRLAAVNWARTGLGLPLLVDDQKRPAVESRKVITEDNHIMNSHHTPLRELNHTEVNHTQKEKSHSVVHVEDPSVAFSRTDTFGGPKKVVFEDIDDSRSSSYDHDDNKYKRRSAMEWFSRWWKTMSRPSARGRHAGHLYKRYLMFGVLFIIALFTIIMIFSWLGNMATRDDPTFELHNNPNVRVEMNKET